MTAHKMKKFEVHRGVNLSSLQGRVRHPTALSAVSDDTSGWLCAAVEPAAVCQDAGPAPPRKQLSCTALPTNRWKP